MSDWLKHPRRLYRPQRARFPVHSGQHSRLSWTERLARNAAAFTSPCVSITLFGIPEAEASAIGLQAL
jgi:hypothetical protein